MKKLSTVIISLFMAVMMGILFPLQVAAEQPTYIKDMAMEYGSTIEEAKEALEAKGYTPIDGNFGQGLNKAVAVGYITTTDKDEAITDLKVMEEDCGYSFTEYEAYLKKQKANVNDLYEDLKAAIDEFRDNYADGDGTQAAAFAYKMMNYYLNDDITDDNNNAVGVGTMFINEDTTKDQFTTLLLQGNVSIMASIEEYLGIACSSNNWVEAAPDCEELADDENATEEQMTAARNIYNTLEKFQEQVKEFEALSINGDSTEDEVEAFCNDENTTDTQKSVALNIYPIYKTLKETSYLDSTLYDVFMSDLDNLKIKKLVPLADTMTEGQIATFSYLPLYESMKDCQMDDDDWEEALGSDTADVVTEDLETVSAYSGVDRTIFTPEGIAMTSAALVKQDSSNLYDLGRSYMNDSTRNAMIALACVGTVVTAAGAALAANATNIAEKIFTKAHQVSSNLEVYTIGAAEDTYLDSGIIRNCRIAGGVAIAIGAALLIYSIINLVIGLVKNKKYKTHSELPRIMVDSVKDDDGNYDMTYYYAVKELSGDLGDLNAWQGEHWIALYYTKDTDAGKPLTTDFVVKYGSAEAPSSDSKTYRAVTMFDSQGAKNLSNHGLYDINDATVKLAAEDYCYLYVAEASTSTTASVFSGGNTTIFVSAFAGLIIGVVATLLIDKAAKKKKEEPATTTSD